MTVTTGVTFTSFRTGNPISTGDYTCRESLFHDWVGDYTYPYLNVEVSFRSGKYDVVPALRDIHLPTANAVLALLDTLFKRETPTVLSRQVADSDETKVLRYRVVMGTLEPQDSDYWWVVTHIVRDFCAHGLREAEVTEIVPFMREGGSYTYSGVAQTYRWYVQELVKGMPRLHEHTCKDHTPNTYMYELAEAIYNYCGDSKDCPAYNESHPPTSYLD